jgi:CheY-like chemotaxis protein
MKLISLKREGNQPARSLFGFRPTESRLRLESAPAARTGTTILLVDDDPIILQTTGAKLRAAGHDVITAGEAAEAISVISEKAPQFIVLDVSLPPDITNPGTSGWDGFRLMFWLRGLQNAQNARYIIISGVDSQELKDRARRSGAIGFLTKPIDHIELLAVLQQEEFAQGASNAPRRWWTALFDFL